MRIIGSFDWDDDENASWARDGWHFVYQLEALGEGCPNELGVFYVGVTNNPLARLFEHMYRPHSGALEAMMDFAQMHGWTISMHVRAAYTAREKAEKKEKELINAIVREGEFQLMNMEGVYDPIAAWIDVRVAMPAEGQHDAHVLAFTRKG